MRRVLVMGVSGSGKTLIGARLALRLALPFVEGDDLHPPASRAKMAAGTPLTDEDRWPWLDRVGAALGGGGVAACSALRRAYRDRLRALAPGLVTLHLTAPEAALRARMATRAGHFMPPALLPSQLATLEPLEADEPGATVVNEGAPEEVVERAVRALGP